MKSLRTLFLWFLSTFVMADDLPQVSIFVPLQNQTNAYRLEQFQYEPFPLQYHGCLQMPSGEQRFVFLYKQELLHLTQGQRSPYGFTLRQVSCDTKEVIIATDEGVLQTLTKGVAAYNIEAFSGLIFCEKTQQKYPFSNKNNVINAGGFKITLHKDSKDPTSIYVTEWHKDKDDCHTYRLSVQALNEAMRERN